MATRNLVIDAGVVRILINDGPHALVFNPTDVVFVERFYAMLREFETRMGEYEEQAAELDKSRDVDAMGIPTNAKQRLEFIHDICAFVFSQIDELFGSDTSLHLFGGMESLDMIEQFFSGLAPLIQETRQKQVAKYTANSGGRKLK